MAIVGSSLEDAGRRFRDHLNRLLTLTITEVPLVLTHPRGEDFVSLGFRQSGRPHPAILKTKYGELGLTLGQNCTAVKNHAGKYQLRTTHYFYHVYDASGSSVLRWEYQRDYVKQQDGDSGKTGDNDPDGLDRYSRHHIQGEFGITLNDSVVRFNDLHAPTGYVCIEDIIRFCICDLRVPYRSEKWHDRLLESYQLFCDDFTQIEGADGER